MTWMPLKDYQRETLCVLGDYCRAVREQPQRGAARPQRDAFETLTNRAYYSPPGFDLAPYVCLRLPTGGGKTLLAAHATGTIARALLHTDFPVCLWITPSTTIRDQTLRRLKTPTDPYRRALDDSLPGDVEVVTLEEALTTPRAVKAQAALVVVTTIQSYRIRDERSGEELASTRRIYRDNGYLQTAFDGLPEWAKAELRRDENGLVELSLANALRLRRPIVIMDEAHNARTPISFESLARFGPSFVLELTATPEQRHDPQHPTEPRFASNVLYAASALELQREGMIKLPVDLESRRDWLEVLAATHHRREDLERLADRATVDHDLPFIRPIALIQAQASSRTRETHTVEKVKAALIEQLHVPAEFVKICTGTIDEIGDLDLMATNCPVRYVITVDKLREGWDCPLAYVLGSIGNAATPRAVEQLIGRVLRMPFATPTRVPALDRAYAFVLSDDVVRTAMELRDRMVETCGFDERSAKDALRVATVAPQARLGLAQIPLSAPPRTDALPTSLTEHMRYDGESHTLIFDDLPSRTDIEALRNSVSDAADRAQIDAFWQRERPLGVAAKNIDQYAKPFRIPRLTVRQDGRPTLLEPEELDTFAWNLHECEPALSEAEFSSEVRVGGAATIDLQGEALVSASASEVRLRQLELVAEGEDWDTNELVRWLDRELHRGDSFQGVSLAESQPWLRRVVESLVIGRGLALPMLVRRRHSLSDALRVKVSAHGRHQIRQAINRLIHEEPNAVETTYEFSSLIEEQNYAPLELFRGHQFRNHAFDQVGDMNGEEVQCAGQIDQHPNVARWIRNADRETQGGFCLPLAPGRFFPDFIAELKDGAVCLVEYKMGKMSRDLDELHKKAVGELWAARSGGKARFAWVVDKDWHALDTLLAR